VAKKGCCHISYQGSQIYTSRTEKMVLLCAHWHALQKSTSRRFQLAAGKLFLSMTQEDSETTKIGLWEPMVTN
jgi:hypothetical protein